MANPSKTKRRIVATGIIGIFGIAALTLALFKANFPNPNTLINTAPPTPAEILEKLDQRAQYYLIIPEVPLNECVSKTFSASARQEGMPEENAYCVKMDNPNIIYKITCDADFILPNGTQCNLEKEHKSNLPLLSDPHTTLNHE